MVKLIAETARKAVYAALFTGGTALVLPSLLDHSQASRFQVGVVLSFFCFCIAALFTYSRYKLFYLLLIPVLTQFLHLFQQYTFELGARSVWRIFPFLALDIYFLDFFLHKKIVLSGSDKLLLLSWILMHLFFLAISPNLSHLLPGGTSLFLLTLPGYYLYFKQGCPAPDFREEMEKYLTLLFILLGLGTFGLVIAGAGYKEASNLLVTRNISDTNVTMAYFILLWPFVIRYANRTALPAGFGLSMTLIFLGVVCISFSRGALLLILPYLLITHYYTAGGFTLKGVIVLLALTAILVRRINRLFNDYDLAYSWLLRFADIDFSGNLWQTLGSNSGRREIHQTAIHLFLQRPITGHGIASFEILGPGFREAHSLFFTLLAETGLTGTLYVYGLLSVLMVRLFRTSPGLLLWGFSFYLIFNHTVGSVWVVISGKAMTVNCIAPVLLLGMYFYAGSRE